jgi:hypothetical protein
LEWAAVTGTVSTVLVRPDKPLKRFRVELSTHDPQLKLGVNENMIRVELSTHDRQLKLGVDENMIRVGA